MKYPTYQTLQEGTHYRLVNEISHAEILGFIRQHLRPTGLPLFLFYAFNIILLLAFLAQIIFSLMNPSHGFLNAGLYFLAGTVVFFLVLIPLHELIHLLTFKILGARETRVFAQWRKLLFYAAADKFVMNFREFLWLALPPFVLLNSGLILLLLFTAGPVKYALWAALIFHSTGCIGDFALISFLARKEHRNYLSYDDISKGVTLFYEKLNDPEGA